MIKRSITLPQFSAFHARPTSVIVREARRFKSEVYIRYGDVVADAKSIMEGLVVHAEVCSATRISEVEIVASGPDEEEAADHVSRLYYRMLNGEIDGVGSILSSPLPSDVDQPMPHH
jgi:phosphotransferase system HPr (HPr) family protein